MTAAATDFDSFLYAAGEWRMELVDRKTLSTNAVPTTSERFGSLLRAM
jgi:hypothetical protein